MFTGGVVVEGRDGDAVGRAEDEGGGVVVDEQHPPRVLVHQREVFEVVPVVKHTAAKGKKARRQNKAKKGKVMGQHSNRPICACFLPFRVGRPTLVQGGEGSLTQEMQRGGRGLTYRGRSGP